jgi:hypothetical protein
MAAKGASNNPSFLHKHEPSDFQALKKLKTLDPSLRWDDE